MTTTIPLPTGDLPAGDLPTLPLPGAFPGAPSDRALLRLALLAEAVLATVTAVESAIVATAFGAPLPVLLTMAVAAALFVAARDAGRGTGRDPVRRWVRVLQWTFLAGAAVDVVAAALTSMPPPPLVPALVRVVLPVTVLVLARRSAAGGRP